MIQGDEEHSKVPFEGRHSEGMGEEQLLSGDQEIHFAGESLPWPKLT